MKIDIIRKLLEEADLGALIEEVEAHPKLDNVIIVTLKPTDEPSGAPRRRREASCVKH